jgi:hypothetical protein
MDDLHRANRVNGELPVERCDALPLPADSVAKGDLTGTPPKTCDGHGQLRETTAYTIDAAIADAIEQMTGEPLPDPFTGDHDIEYWIWTGSRLVPATPEAAERIRQQEAVEEEEFRARRERQHLYTIRHQQAFRRVIGRLAVPLRQAVVLLRSSNETRRAEKR